jgi:sigma-B regulation protein RsbQ
VAWLGSEAQTCSGSRYGVGGSIVSVISRNNVHIRGKGDRAMVFAHGFGCDQDIWRFVAPSFERDYVTVLFDHVGAGRSQLSAYSTEKYSTLDGYANDVLELGRELDLENAVFVGHSCGAMIGALASIQARDMFTDLVMIGPSPRYINDADYTGGFSESQVDEMLASLGNDYSGWSSRMAPVLMGNPERPELSDELMECFRRTDSTIAKDFARAVFRSDVREELPLVKTRSLILQSRYDYVAPTLVGQYLHRHIADSKLVMMDAQGHFPQLSAPSDAVAAISAFLERTALEGKGKGEGGRRGAKPPMFPHAVPGSAPFLGLNAHAAAAGKSMTEELRNELQESLLSRMGEMYLQLGRYDMYALSLQGLLNQKLGTGDEQRLTLRTRGAEIIRLMAELPAETRAHFMATDLELRKVLDRHEISARHGAVIPGVHAGCSDSRWFAARKSRDWFDQANSSVEDIRTSLEAVERDILKIVSLCFRVSFCALAVERAR